MELTIIHDKNAKQFTADISGKISSLNYTVSADGKTLDYYHTFVPPELRGQQIAEHIVKYVLEYAKNNHYKVKPSCPYVQRYIDRHPEYNSLISK